MIHCETIDPRLVDAVTRRAWVDLVAAEAFGTPLLHPDFAALVASVRPDARAALFHDGAGLKGVFPHHRRPDGLARGLAAPFADYQALVAPVDFPLSGPEALKAAGLSAFRFDALYDPHALFATGRSSGNDASAVVLDVSAETYLEARRAENPKRFKNHRRLARQMERDSGELVLIAPDHDRSAFDLLLTRKRAQYARTGRHDVLAPDWARTLMTHLFEEGEGEVRGLMLTLCAGGQPVAGLFGIRAGAVYHPWIAAFDSDYAPYSPGQVLLHKMIEAMAGLGLTRVDLGSGHDHYKKYYASHSAPVWAGQASAPGPAGARARFGDALWDIGARLPTRRLAEATMRARRRFDQISAAEQTTAGRLNGFVRAARFAGAAAGEEG